MLIIINKLFYYQLEVNIIYYACLKFFSYKPKKFETF